MVEDIITGTDAFVGLLFRNHTCIEHRRNGV
jgi:hypothetical protein